MAITEEVIDRNTTEQSFGRGYAYYNSGYVLKLVRRGSRLQSQVSGYGTEYRINISLQGEDDVQIAWCTCPYHHSNQGWCKHIVATLLAYIHKPDTVQHRLTLEEMIDPLSKAEALSLLRDMVAWKPELVELVDRIITGEGDSESEEGDY
jgi:uncharacterized Zn finger protein